MSSLLALLLVVSPSEWPVVSSAEVDSDGDGLSDFHEVHKHRTDPARADSDGDGVPDGDWFERREFTYVVRTVVHVLRPVTPATLTDDFQDARVLEVRDDVVELEVLLYPYSTAPEALRSDPDWRESVAAPELAPWLAPGPTSDWDAELAAELTAALAADGIDVDALDDRALVERASAWLMRHADYVDGFTTFSTAFDEDGEPFVPEDLVPHVGDGTPPTSEDWDGELSAKGMFRRGQRGSCTSSAIYLSGCLRALGIPTRTVLCIPLLDAGDEREWQLVREGIREPRVRAKVLTAMRGSERAWSSHTFNEVFVGGRWWRLDYHDLGVGILRSERFGLLTHVATFRDWADAGVADTIGRRHALGRRDARLDGANPYSMISVSDAWGVHSSRDWLVVPQLEATIESFTWSDDPNLPEDVRSSVERSGRFGLFARVTGVSNGGALRELLDVADLRLFLDAPDRPSLSAALDPGYWWFQGDHALVFVRFATGDEHGIAERVAYRPRLLNEHPDVALAVDPDVRITRGS